MSRRVLSAALRALDTAPSDARRLLDALRPRRDQLPPAEQIAAGLIAFDARRYDDALAWLDAAGRLQDPLATGALTQAASLAEQLGWNHRAIAFLRRRQELQPDHVGTRQRLADLFAQTRNWEDAVDVLDSGPIGPRGALLRADLLVRLADPRARAAVGSLEAAPLQRAALFGRLGAHEDALEALGDADGSARALCLLRSGRFDEARAVAAALDGAVPAMVQGASLLAGGPPLFAEGEAAAALTLLDAAVEADPNLGEALLWRAEARLRLGDEAGALADIDSGVLLSGGYVLGARLLRYLLEVRAARRPTVGGLLKKALEPFAPLIPSRGGRRINAGILEELGPGLRAVGFDRAALDRLASRDGVEGVVPAVIARLGGDRTPSGPPSPRARARRCLELIRSLPPEAVLERFATVNAELGPSSMGLVHQGELRLWMGDWDGALADFRGCLGLNRHTRWGWIGQLGTQSLGGDPEEALRVGAKGVEVMGGYGPSHYVYRAEALRRLGRLDEARADLEHAVEINPTRLGAWVTLALLTAEQGDDARFGAVIEHVVPRAAGLLARAAEELGVDLGVLWPDPGGHREHGALRPVLARAHAMMRGNRSSSCLTWFTGDGELRLTHRPRDGDNDVSLIGSATRRTRAARLLSL